MKDRFISKGKGRFANLFPVVKLNMQNSTAAIEETTKVIFATIAKNQFETSKGLIVWIFSSWAEISTWYTELKKIAIVSKCSIRVEIE